MTEAEARATYIAVLQSWVGRKGGSAGHKEIVDIYNSIRPLPAGYKLQYTDAWCAGTVSAAAQVVDFTDIIFPECSCNRMIALYQKVGRWVEDDAYVPMMGDIVMYDWQDDKKNYATTDNRGEADHVGPVEYCDGKTMIVIEGNKSNAVGRRELAVNGLYIRGFCIPDYAAKAKQLTVLEDENMTGKDIYDKLQEYLKTQTVPAWAKAEFQEAIKAGITDGQNPMQIVPRYQAAIMALRAKK